MKLNSLGMIKGGVCEKLFQRRTLREQGSRIAWEWLNKNKCIRVKNGWYKITKLPQKAFALRYVINQCHNGDIEIGWRRFMTDVADQLYKQHRRFRLRWMQKWIEDIASFELGARSEKGEALTAAHSLGGGPSKVIFGYARAHQPQLYKKYKALKGQRHEPS